MSIKRTLADWGLVEDETLENSSNAKPTSAISITSPSVAVPSANTQGVDDNVLRKLTSEVNQSAPSKYVQFHEMLTRMESVPSMTAAARYQAAAAAVNFTKADMDAAIDALLDRLGKEESEFSAQIETATQTKVGSKRDEVATLKAASDEDRSRIADLEAAISKRGQEVSAKEAEINAALASIQLAESTFKNTAAHVRSGLEQERTNGNQQLTS